jgi:tetratricopeptide (TPR) repeat protein
MPEKNDREFKELLRQIANTMQKKLGPCPEKDALISYHLRELPEAEAENIREHLALCARCVAELKQIVHFFDVVAEAPVTPTTPDEKRWENLLQALKQETTPNEPLPALQEFREKSWKTKKKFSFSPGEFIARRIASLFLKPELGFAILFLSIFIGAGVIGLLRLQRPDYWTNSHYANLVDLKSDLHALRNRGTRSPDNLKTDAIQDLADSSFSSAKSKLLKYAKTDSIDEEVYRLLALTYLLTAKQTFLIDYGFDKGQVNQAIGHLQHAKGLAKNNVFAQEEILWLLGRAYAMLGDFETARNQYQAILDMKVPGLIRKREAQQALEDLAALTASLQPSPR